MHHNLNQLSKLAANPDLRRVCLVLRHYQPGEVVDASEVAILTGLDVTTTMFFLDTLEEVGALVLEPTPEVALAA